MKRLALLVLCALADPAAAEINMADSVEWQTIDADAIGWLASQSVDEREQGVRVLRHFKSKPNIARLTALLAEAGSAQVTETGKPMMKRYLVRIAAHEVLAAWGVGQETPLLEERMKK